jgi:membrane-associated phospholipid phosphatase
VIGITEARRRIETVALQAPFLIAIRMSHRGIITLPPSHVDVVVSRACARIVTPRVERVLQVVTWLADEKIVLGATVLFWTYTRLSRRTDLARRPDRVVVHGRRHGIPRSGNAWDSFPSGHALHLGAIVGSLTRLCPDRFRILVWPSITALVATRIMLLAHYVSDVVAGLVLGAAIDKLVGRLFNSVRATLIAKL